MKEAIKTISLTKSYKEICAVSDNNLSIQQGEIYGFLGLNGAGKTTTIRMLLGLVNPTSGQAFINGNLIQASNTEIWGKVGYLVEVPYAYPMLTVRENLELMYGLRKLKDKTAVDDIVEKLELGAYSNRKTKHLSLGNKQRLGLAKALMHNPEILILDEPTNGLDPAGIHDIRELLSDLAKNHGVTIFVSSHILGEISQFATRIGIIHQGKIIQEIQSNELEKLCNKQLLVETNQPTEASQFLKQKGFSLEKNSNGQIFFKDKAVIESPQIIAKLLVNNGFELKKLNVEEENLESYFLRTIKEKEDKS